MDKVFECVGKGVVVVDGKEVEAELKFKGKLIDNADGLKTISFDLLEQELGEDKILYAITLKP